MAAYDILAELDTLKAWLRRGGISRDKFTCLLAEGLRCLW